MTRMTGPDCVVMCNLINTHTHTHTHTQQGRKRGRKWGRSGDGSGGGNESSNGNGNGDDGDGDGNENEDGIDESRGETKKRKKPHKICRRDVGNRGDLVEWKEKIT